MNLLKYHDFAIDFGSNPHPVIVTDPQLKAVYFNPAASRCDVILICEDVMERAATEEIMEQIALCRDKGQSCQFTMTLGDTFTREFSVALRHKKGWLIFELTPLVTPEEMEREQLLAPYHFGYELLTRSTLHQLLGAMEILEQAEDDLYRTIGTKSRRQVLRSLRIAQLVEHLEGDLACNVISFPELLSIVMEEAEGFVEKNLDKKLHFSYGVENTYVKCDAALMRSLLLNLLSCLYEQGAGQVYAEYTVTAQQVVLMLRGQGEGPKEEFATPLLPWADICQRLIRRMQGTLEIKGSGNHLCFCLTMPIAHTDSGICENLKELFQDQISQLELAFSELI